MHLDAVVQAAKAGDSEAWEHVYRRFHPALTRYAASRGVPDPEDVAQEVIFCAVRQIDELEGGWDNLRAWLFTVAYRRCADRHRRRYRRPETLTEAVPEGPSAVEGADVGFWAGAEAREAMDALSILSPREREVVTMRVLDESTTEAVAARLDMSRVNVRVTQSRALAKLRAHLENNGGYLDKRFRVLLLPGLTLRLVRRLRHVGDGTGSGSQSVSALGGTGASAAAPILAGGANTLVAAFVAVSATAGTMFSPAEAASPRSDAELVSPQAAVVEQVEIDQPPMSRVEPGPGASDGSPSVYDGDAVPVTTPEQPITTREAEPGDAGPAGAGVGEGDLPSDLPGKPEGEATAPVDPEPDEVDSPAGPTPDADEEGDTTQTDGAGKLTDVVNTAAGAVADTTEQTLDEVDSLVDDVDALVHETVSGVTEVVEEVPIELVSELAEEAEAAVEATVDAVTDTTDAVTDGATEATQKVTDTVSEATETVEEAVDESVDAVDDVVGGLGESLFGG